MILRQTVLMGLMALAIPALAPASDLVVRPLPGEMIQAKETATPIPARIEVGVGERSESMTATGSGLRTKLTFKVYEAVLYLGDSVSDLPANPYPALVKGNYPRRVEMHFLRDVDRGKIVGAWESAFDDALGDDVSADLLANRDRFIDFFRERDFVTGDAVALTWYPGSGLHTVIGGKDQPVIDDQRIATAVFAVWLGEKPISRDLKRDLWRFRAGD